VQWLPNLATTWRRLVEGPRNDAVSILAEKATFSAGLPGEMRQWGLNYHGSLIEQMNQVFVSPYAAGLQLTLTRSPGSANPNFPNWHAGVTYSSMRAVDRPDPDSAMVSYVFTEPPNETIMAAITGYQRGWLFIIALLVVGLEIGRGGQPPLVEDVPSTPVTATVAYEGQAPIIVDGSIAIGQSIIT
jgi:hypothetical protein